MVIGESKPLAEILEKVKDFKKIVVAGCKGCVTVCCVGGEKEVAILASELRIARKSADDELEVKEYTCERQCDPDTSRLWTTSWPTPTPWSPFPAASGPSTSCRQPLP